MKAFENSDDVGVAEARLEALLTGLLDLRQQDRDLFKVGAYGTPTFDEMHDALTLALARCKRIKLTMETGS